MKATTKRFLTGMLAATISLSSISPVFASSEEPEENIFSSIGGWFSDCAADVQNGMCTATSATVGWFVDRGEDISGAVSIVGGWTSDRVSDVQVILLDTGETIGYWVGSIDPAKLSDQQYYLDSGEKFLLGDYSEKDPTNLSLGLNIASSVVGADLPMDVRDLVYDIQNLDSEEIKPMGVVIDAVAVIPVIGVVKHLKYVDTISDSAKAISNAADIARDVEKNAEIAADIAKAADTADTVSDVAKAADIADNITDAVKGIEKVPFDELPEEVQDMYKMYDSCGWDGKKAMENLADGNQAGKPFKNRDGLLPKFDAEGNKLSYNEFDSYIFGSDPGAEFNDMITRGQSRFIRDNLGNVFFTNNHHESYRLITM